MKYIIGVHKLSYHFIPVVFADEVVHLDIAGCTSLKECDLLGAGFVNISAVNFKDFDKIAIGLSDSLNLKPSPLDGRILHFFLHHGLSGLQLFNHLTMLDIQEGGAE